jgi:hypothetical protein
LALVLAALPLYGHDPITTNLTWNNDISRLIARHCASCHREGGMAMSLMTYPEARPWAKAIRNEVLARRMPPFDPVKGLGEFRDDPSLTQPEIELFVAWVEGGAPEGAPGPPAQPVVAQAPGPSCQGAAIRVRSSRLLMHPVTLCGILPDGPLEVTALLPDESVRRLIWIRDFHPRWNRIYVFRSPLSLPGGTRILVYSPKGADARLLITH